jgi:tetratricopeptide (TPR) repeat protein
MRRVTEPTGAVPPETIGERLRRLRHERGLSQRELSAPGVSYAYISRIEAGTRQPSVKALRKLARKLGVTADYLETGSTLGSAEQLELRIADAELGIRLEEDAADAEQALEQLLEQALEIGDRAAAARARIALGFAAAHGGRHPEAILRLQEAIADDSVSSAARPDVYAALGRAYVAAGMNDRAVEVFQACLEELSEQAPDNVAAQVRFATYLSQALANLGDLNRAEGVIGDALGQAHELADPYTHVRLYWSLARLASMQGEPQLALEHVRRAIALLEATEDTLQLARAHLLSAAILNLQGKGEDAGRALEQAVALLGPKPDRVDLASLRAEQAKSAALVGEADEALRLADQAIDLVGDDDPAERGGALLAKAQGLALKGDVGASNAAFAESAELLSRQGQWREAAYAYRTWGRLLRKVGREDEALDALDRAAELATRSERAANPAAP